MKRILAFGILLLCSSLIFGADFSFEDPVVTVQQLDIDINVYGPVSYTEMTLRLYNPSDTQRGGNISIPLPTDAVVSGMALDINGKMRDAVPVETNKARTVYESFLEVRRDPAIVEHSDTNLFITRVFPVPAKGYRTIKINFTAPLDISNNYLLPLRYKKMIEDLRIKAVIHKSPGRPAIYSNILGSPTAFNDTFTAETSKTNYTPDEDLKIEIPSINIKEPLILKDSHGVFLIQEVAVPESTVKTLPSNPHIKIVLDTSFSMREAQLEKLDTLARTIAGAQTSFKVSVWTMTLKDTHNPFRTFQFPSQKNEFNNYVSGINFDGATSFSARETSRINEFVKDADYSVFITDGIESISLKGSEELSLFDAVISESSVQNGSFLRSLSRNGVFFSRVQDAIENSDLLKSTAYSLELLETDGSTKGFSYKRLPGRNSILAALELNYLGDSISFNLSNGIRDQIKEYKLNDTVLDTPMGSRIYGSLVLEDMMNKNSETSEIRSIGERFGLVTKGTSLLVLESIDQYLEYSVVPPASEPALRTAYNNAIQNRQKNIQKSHDQRTQELVQMWNNRVSWWNNPPRPQPAKSEEPVAVNEAEAPMMRAMDEESLDSFDDFADETVGGVRASNVVEAETAVEADMDEISADKKDAAQQRGSSIQIQGWDPETPYINELKATSLSKQYVKYLELRKDYENSPSFFLDMGNYFISTQRSDIGVLILSNLAEMQLKNPGLYRIMAYRLNQAERYNLSSAVLAEVLEMRPTEAQSYRDYALALANAEKYEEAFEYFMKALYPDLAFPDNPEYSNGPLYDASFGQTAEYELIILMELNAWLPEMNKWGVDTALLDARLKKLLDLDIRITMTWDADLTDMDLWVIEPSKEKAYYGYRHTRSGGLVSRDITNGYGPEEYLIRQAPSGEYEIRVHYYSSRSPELSGPVSLQVEVFTNFGRFNQEKQVLTLRLEEQNKNYLVGTIRFD